MTRRWVDKIEVAFYDKYTLFRFVDKIRMC